MNQSLKIIPISHADVARTLRAEIDRFETAAWRRSLAFAVSLAGYRILFVLNTLLARGWLAWKKSELRAMGRIVLMQVYSFGIIIEGTDAIRRKWRDEACGVIVPYPILGFRGRADANPWLTELNGGFNIFLIPAIQGLNLVRPLRLFTWPQEAQLKFQSSFLPRLAAALPNVAVDPLWWVLEDFEPQRELSRGNENYGFHVVAAALRMERPTPGVHLKPEVRRMARAAVQAASAPDLARTANFYMRQKNTTDSMSKLRNGGPFEDYLPAIEVLTRRGFVVLVNGDVKIPSDLRDAWKGRLLDAEACGLDGGLFSLYAATECDISIGEPGGGFWLPTINGTPSLMINAFPLYMGREHTTLLFKGLRTKAGERIPIATQLRERIYDHHCADLDLCNNSPEEIAAAVEEFLDFTESEATPTLPHSLVDLLPWDSFARICRSRYSPVWLRQDEQAVSQ